MADPIQELKDAQQVMVDQYGQQGQVYNNNVNQFYSAQKPWEDAYSGIVAGNEGNAYINSIRGDAANGAKYRAYLDELANNQYLDPYAQQKIDNGDMGKTNINDILKKYLTQKPMDPKMEAEMKKEQQAQLDALVQAGINAGAGTPPQEIVIAANNTNPGPTATTYDSGVRGVGYDTMQSLAEGAGINDPTRTAEAQAQARTLLNNWRQANSTIGGAYNTTVANAGESGLRGGGLNQKLNSLASSSQGMVNDIAANQNDWRTKWLNTGNTSNQAYAAGVRNDSLANSYKNITMSSPITNMDLKMKWDNLVGTGA